MLAANKKLEAKIRALILVKFHYFAPDRKFLGALSGYSADPAHRLSPFSDETKEIREEGMAQFREALAQSEVKVPADLVDALPKVLWMYQMGMVLFWIYDHSKDQRRTTLLMDKSLGIVVLLLRASTPLAVFLDPVSFSCSARAPQAVFSSPSFPYSAA